MKLLKKILLFPFWGFWKLLCFVFIPFKWIGNKTIDLLAWIGDAFVNLFLFTLKKLYRLLIWILYTIFNLFILLVNVIFSLFKLLFYITIGRLFSKIIKRDSNLNRKEDSIWAAMTVMPGKNPKRYRQDAYGNTIFKQSYGKDTPMGWVIDHKWPVSKGGSNEEKNLQALQTSENRSKSNLLVYRPLKKFVISLRNATSH
jgi:hypothetical protein